MKIAVNDTNILIDLMDIDLINSLFELDVKFYTTEYVIDEFN
jgi:hypothetical protein